MMDPIAFDDSRGLRVVTTDDVDELFALVLANQARLEPWMPWAHDPKREDTAAFLAAARTQLDAGDGFHAAVTQGDRIAGIAGFHRIDRLNRSTSIGYWLGADAAGRGTMTLAIGALVDHAFASWGLHRIELRAAPHNTRSRAVAERLGFTQEGVLREAERFADRYGDLVVYSLLEQEWREAGAD